MSLIKVNIDYVLETNLKIAKSNNNLSTEHNEMISTKSGIDSKILARKGISSQLYEAHRNFSELESKLLNLNNFINNSMQKYSDAEDKINKSFREDVLGEKDSYWGSLLKTIMGSPKTSSLLALLSKANSRSLLVSGKNLRFKIFKEDGKVLVKLINSKINGRKDFERVRSYLIKELGGSANKWTKDIVHQLGNEGIALYDKAQKRFFKKNNTLFNKTEFFDDLKIHALNATDTIPGKIKTGFKTFETSGVDGLKIWKDFYGYKGQSLLTKAGKGLGVFGTVLTGINNWNSAYDENGQFNAKKFVVDTGVDVAATAGAMATGAAVGSFFAPPIGTVVGAGVGAVANFLINKDLPKLGTSIVGKGKELANKAVDSAFDSIGKLADGIGKKIGFDFW